MKHSNFSSKRLFMELTRNMLKSPIKVFRLKKSIAISLKIHQNWKLWRRDMRFGRVGKHLMEVSIG